MISNKNDNDPSLTRMKTIGATHFVCAGSMILISSILSISSFSNSLLLNIDAHVRQRIGRVSNEIGSIWCSCCSFDLSGPFILSRIRWGFLNIFLFDQRIGLVLTSCFLHLCFNRLFSRRSIYLCSSFCVFSSSLAFYCLAWDLIFMVGLPLSQFSTYLLLLVQTFFGFMLGSNLRECCKVHVYIALVLQKVIGFIGRLVDTPGKG